MGSGSSSSGKDVQQNIRWHQGPPGNQHQKLQLRVSRKAPWHAHPRSTGCNDKHGDCRDDLKSRTLWLSTSTGNFPLPLRLCPGRPPPTARAQLLPGHIACRVTATSTCALMGYMHDHRVDDSRDELQLARIQGAPVAAVTCSLRMAAALACLTLPCADNRQHIQVYHYSSHVL